MYNMINSLCTVYCGCSCTLQLKVFKIIEICIFLSTMCCVLCLFVLFIQWRDYYMVVTVMFVSFVIFSTAAETVLDANIGSSFI